MRRSYIIALAVFLITLVPFTYAMLLLFIWSIAPGAPGYEEVVTIYWRYDFPAINAGLIYIGIVLIFAWAKEQEEKYQERLYKERSSLNKLDTSWLL